MRMRNWFLKLNEPTEEKQKEEARIRKEKEKEDKKRKEKESQAEKVRIQKENENEVEIRPNINDGKSGNGESARSSTEVSSLCLLYLENKRNEREVFMKKNYRKKKQDFKKKPKN